MPLIKSELLIPRVLCIGGKEGEPNDTSNFWVTGQIIEFGINMPHVWFNGIKFTFEDFIKFPHLFKPLPWWEGRIVEEMPKYVRFTIDSNGTVHKKDEVVKILGWHDDETGEGNLYFTYENDPKGDLGQYPYLYQPADEADYQEYQKQKEA